MRTKRGGWMRAHTNCSPLLLLIAGILGTACNTVSASGGISVAVSPQATETTPGGSLSFNAVVAGAKTGQSTAVTWAVQEGAAGGAVSSSGGYTAPATSGTYHVVAASVADPSRS